MRVYDDQPYGDNPEGIFDSARENDYDMTLADFAAELRESHEDARWIIACCDEVAADIEKGNIPDWIVEQAEQHREDDDPSDWPAWVTEVLTRKATA